jgi:hypothetical protein
MDNQITLNYIIERIRGSWSTYLTKDSEIYVYGSAVNSSLYLARDIDIFSLSYDKSINSVIRLESLVEMSCDIKKRASIYIVPFDYFLDDIFNCSCGGRWTVIGLHGLWSNNQYEINKIMAISLAGVFYHYNIPDTIKPSEKLRVLTHFLCVHYPFYARSAIAIALSPERWGTLEKLYEIATNSVVYKEMKEKLKKYGKRISKKEQMMRYFSSETSSRPKVGGSSFSGISSLNDKINRTVDYVRSNSSVLNNIFGSETTKKVLSGLKAISQWDNDNTHFSESVKCEYRGQNVIHIEKNDRLTIACRGLHPLRSSNP